MTLNKAEELLDAGLIAGAQLQSLARVGARYAIGISPAIAALIDRSDPDDPIARQFVPTEAELKLSPEEMHDPIGDARHSPVAGIVHRHEDRVLLKLVHTCPVYCRFCFRRETVGPAGDGMLSGAELDAALDYIAAHREIWEVIVTGGDPLILSDRRLAMLTARLAGIDHVRILRWHTRVPVVEPARVTAELVESIRLSGRATFVALHANHPRELSPAARVACARIVDAGIPMLSQSVLLKGVNDDIDTLEALMRAFVEARIKPYYLHHPDLAPGTSHFRLSVEQGQALIRQLRARASGLCQPEYVLDIPGGYAKARLAPSDIDAGGLRDHDGRRHPYPPVNTPAAAEAEEAAVAEQAAARIAPDARDTTAD
jgi:lysine 2,3-aminomutase